MKTCSACKTPQPESEYSRRSASPDGLAYTCKTCASKYAKRLYRENSESYKARARSWAKQNRDHRTATNRRHKAARLTNMEWARVVASSGFRCVYCGDAPEVLEVDHATPLSKGGGNDPDNLVPSCKPCNRSKSGLDVDEWVYREFGVEGLGRVLFFLENRKIHPALYGIDVQEV